MGPALKWWQTAFEQAFECIAIASLCQLEQFDGGFRIERRLDVGAA